MNNNGEIYQNNNLSFLVSVTMGLVRTVTYVYEIVTWPIYTIFRSDEILPTDTNTGPILAYPTLENDYSSPWRCVEALSDVTLARSLFPETKTLDEMWSRAVRLWPDKKIVGIRKLLKVEMEEQSNGRKFKKLTQGEYNWLTYRELESSVDGISRGLLFDVQLKPRIDPVLIFAETRAEWQLVAQACFRNAMPLVTLYATLGDDALVHSVEETEVRVIFTSDELLSKVGRLLSRMKQVEIVIYMRYQTDGIVEGDDFILPNSWPSNVKLMTLNEFIANGLTLRNDLNDVSSIVKPTRDDLAVIMYTSGSTDQPKGVEMTHGNLMCSMAGQSGRLPPLYDSDKYIAYLPLAHVLELCCETVLLARGIPIGYGSPLTLTDNSSKVKHGSKGDIVELQATLMACVPTVLDRLHKTVWEKVNEGGVLKKAIFQWALDFRLRRLERGFPSLLLDRILFHKIRGVLGGHVRLMLSGGAPLSDHAQTFINTCFCRIVQGYGLTETCGSGTLSSANNLRSCHTGAPLRCLEIKLRSWEEGNYYPTDKPYPRGEILIGGDCVARGYYKQPEKTREDFLIDSNNRRWFATGDIGMFYLDGTLAIVDRKKDLVKLQTGEYISLGKVELALSACAVVETVCVFGDSRHNAVVTIIVPKQKALQNIAAQVIGSDATKMDIQQLCQHKDVRKAVLRQLQEIGREKRLERLEIPAGVYLDHNPWTPDTGLVTDALKLKRRVIQIQFQQEIDKMYAVL